MHYKKHLSHLLLIIHLLFTDVWRVEDGEDDNWECEPEQEPSYGKRWVWNKVYIHSWTCIRDNKIDQFT